MNLSNAIYRRLTSDTAVSSYVHNRVWESEAESPQAPYIVFDVERQVDDWLDARHAPDTNASITVVASSVAERNNLSDAVFDCLNRQSWTDGNVTVCIALHQGDSKLTIADDGNVDRIFYTVEQLYHFVASIS